MADVAALAGVSKMTVSRALKDVPTVSADVRKRILEAVVALNYTPNVMASALSGAAQLRIGLIYNDRRGAFASEFLIGAFDEASKRNVQLVAVMRGADEDTGVAMARAGLDTLDGFIALPPLSDAPGVAPLLSAAGIPSVAIATEAAEEMSVIYIDDHDAAVAVTRHLVALGHRRIGFIRGDPNSAATDKRWSGYRQALSEAGIGYDPALVAQGLFSYRSGLTATEQLLTAAAPPTAIFASNDDMAAAAIATAHRLGFDVPADLAVCGFDDSPIARNMWPELTTVRQPIEDMARIAVRMLLQLAPAWRSGDRPILRRQLEYTFIQRASDGPPKILATTP